MKRPHLGSLGGRLSTWLAIQTFAGLALVSVVVYLVVAWDMEQRQVDSLAHKRALVEHVLEEAHHDRDIEDLKHKLNDFFTGHPDMALRLARDDGSVIYDNTHGVGDVSEERALTFSVPDWEATGSQIRAQMRLSTQADDRFLARLGATLLGASLLGALIVSLGSYFLVHHGLRPLHSLALQMRGLDASNLQQRLDGTAQASELQPLVEQFNALMDRLERAYLQLEGFNADVAHEMQTPLTTLTTSIEVALLQGRYPAEVADLLGSNLEELRRLTGIIREMLFLSHADSGKQAQGHWVSSLAELAQVVSEYHEAAMADARLSITIDGDAAGEFDAGLVKRALSNLLGNATRYATQGSTIVVSISATQGWVELAVANHGRPIEPADLPRLFDRFYRADSARSQGQHLHHGLGLSIVAAIARMHGGSVLASSGQGVTRIGMRLPQRADVDGRTHPGLPVDSRH